MKLSLNDLKMMKKKDIIELFKYKCRHGHNGFAHYNCYCTEERRVERIGFLDIEASNLKANFGIMLSWAIKPGDSDEVLYDVVEKADMEGTTLDSRIVASCIETMQQFDKVVGHYSTKYDIPFIRTRALALDLGHLFPKQGEMLHEDTYYMAKSKLCLHSNRQDCVAETIQHINIKTRIDPDHWIRALQGKKEALDYIVEHNIMDVLQLEQNYLKLKPFVWGKGKSV